MSKLSITSAHTASSLSVYRTLIAFRNQVIHTLYVHVLKPFFFRRDPEEVHDRMVRVGRWLGARSWRRGLVGYLFGYNDARLEQVIKGIHFPNPVGLSAGFDKNGELTGILPSVGFGFAEIGSVTGEPCEGNAKPRLWRLPKSRSLVVNYGLKNDGCEVIAARIAAAQRARFGSTRKTKSIPFGMSIAMTNCAATADLDAAIQDYAKAFRIMEPVADYLTVNISCPNTSGGQPFIDPQKLSQLFSVLDAIPTTKPIFIKLSPDMSEEQLDALLEVVKSHRIHGIVCTNLTKKRDNPNIIDEHVPVKGGMSGKVVQQLGDHMISHIYRRYSTRFILIGSGGVFTAEDAYKKIRAGASLVQIITGMIFQGPQVINEINRGLVGLLERDGYGNISEAIGVDSHR